MPVPPGALIENTLKVINANMNFCTAHWHLNWGALWGLVYNDGIIPDHDMDISTWEDSNWKKIRTCFENRGYVMTRALLNDKNPDRVVYMAFSSPKLLHICLTFLQHRNGHYWYCHDQGMLVQGVGIPPQGYFFKGIPDSYMDMPLTDPLHYAMIEWPGIVQSVRASVPRFPGMWLDHNYPCHPYRRQRYNIDSKHTIIPEKMVSIHKGGAISPYMVHLQSMGDFDNEQRYADAFAEGQRNFKIHVKNIRK